MSSAVDDARSVRTPALTRQALAVAVTTGVGQLAVAGMYVMTARTATVEQFGRVVSLIALSTVLAGALDFGMNAYLARELARGTVDDRDVRDQLARKLVVSLAAFLLAALVGGVVDPIYYVALPLAAGTAFGQASLVPLRSRGKGMQVAAAVLVDKATAILTFMALLTVGVASTTRLWIALTAGTVAGGLFATLTSPERPWLTARVRPWRNPWEGGLHFGVFSLAVSAQALDVPLAAVAGGANTAGLYGAVSRWTAPMTLLTSAYSQVSAPVVASSRTARGALRRIRATLWMPLLSAAACVVVIAAAPALVDLLVGARYADSVTALQVLAAAALCAVLNQPLAVFLQSRRSERYVGAVTAGCILGQLAAVAPFVLLWGATGAAAAAALGQLLLLVLLVAHGARGWAAGAGRPAHDAGVDR